MIFSEQKKDDKFIYKVNDVFGEMEFVSGARLDAGMLDQVFMAIFKGSKNNSSKIIEGDIDGIDLKYKFIKKNQWDKIEDEELESASYELKYEKKDYSGESILKKIRIILLIILIVIFLFVVI